MLMSGSWHIYRVGEPWQRSPASARIVVGTETFVAVGFSVPIAEFVASGELDTDDALTRLGPDVLGADFDPRVAAERLAASTRPTAAEALLHQQAVAGIGNVFKSELLFLAGIYPFATPGGWNLLGRSLVSPFDGDHALFSPGDRVRLHVAVRGETPGALAPPSATRTHALVVVRAAPAFVQDLGRVGRLAEGVPVGGALVPSALVRANRLAGAPGVVSRASASTHTSAIGVSLRETHPCGGSMDQQDAYDSHPTGDQQRNDREDLIVHLLKDLGPRIVAATLTERMAASHVDRCAPPQIRQSEIHPTIPTEGRSKQREQRLVLVDRQQLPIAQRPPFRREHEAHDPDLAQKRLRHIFLLTPSAAKRDTGDFGLHLDDNKLASRTTEVC